MRSQVPATRVVSTLKAAASYGIVAVGVTVILLVATEGLSRFALRASGWVNRHVQPPPSQYAGKPWVDALQRETAAAERYQYHPYVIWRRAPYEGQQLVIDSNGLRRTLHTACGEGALNIFMFGGSALWGSGSPDWGTIPSQVAKVLEDNSGRPACVRNYGESAWVSTQEVLQLILALKDGERPDLVLFYDGWNDITSRYQTGVPDAHANLYDIKEQFERSPARRLGGSSGTMKLVDRISTALKFRKPYLERYRLQEEPLDVVPASIRDRYLRNVEIVDALADRYGFRYAFFWQPMILAEEKALTDEEQRIVTISSVHPDLTRMTQETYRLMKDTQRPNLFYVGDVFREEPNTVYLDWVHVDPEANGMIARRMVELLQSRGYLKGRKG